MRNVDWIQLSWDRAQRRDYVDTLINILTPLRLSLLFLLLLLLLPALFLPPAWPPGSERLLVNDYDSFCNVIIKLNGHSVVPVSGLWILLKHSVSCSDNFCAVTRHTKEVQLLFSGELAWTTIWTAGAEASALSIVERRATHFERMTCS